MDIHNNRIAINSFSILMIILIEGFVTIAVEMLTIRQLITVVGNSVIITSLIIGVFLLFLALGYFRGGKYSSNYRQILKRNFIWSSLLLGVGLSYIFIQFTFLYLFKITTDGLLALTLYLLLITAPLVYLLGQTVPITTNLFRNEHVGAISGKVLSISTLGSFLGSIVTTLVLMNFLGVAWTVFFNFLLLLLLVILLMEDKKDYLYLFSMVFAGIFIYLLNVELESKFFLKTNNYADYQILTNISYGSNQGNLLSINNSPSSFLTANQKAFPYIETIKRIIFDDLQVKDKDILVLGAGGFSLSAERTEGNHFLYVDIDGSLPAIAKQGFIAQINGQFISDDARKYLLHTTKKFDVIVSDVYSNRYTVPFHLITKEYFQAIKNVLNRNGVAIFNIIANPTLRDNYSKRVDNTLRSVFKDCMVMSSQYWNSPSNILYICTATDNADTTIYTDNQNRSMIDIFNMQ